MPNDTYNARVTAVSMAHGTALVRLLRAHGKAAHAESLAAALDEVFRIVSADLGPETLVEAMRWVAAQSDDEVDDGADAVPAVSRH